MKYLDKKCEESLKKIIEIYNQKNSSMFVITEETANKMIVNELSKQGIIIFKKDCSDSDMFNAFIELTHSGLNYFNNKKSEKRRNCWRVLKEWAKFLLPIAISIAALIVSIVK